MGLHIRDCTPLLMEAAENDYRTVHRKTWRDSRDGSYRAAVFAKRDPFSGIAEHAEIRPAEAAGEWQDSFVMHDLRGLDGKRASWWQDDREVYSRMAFCGAF